MNIKVFAEIIHTKERFVTGVPDSQLRAFCDYLMEDENTQKHVIAANEGNAVALAAGYHMATGKVPLVYMQNSGIGNAVNPVVSLLNSQVYGIPCFFVIGWRGEPGVKDEPQHIFQGEITCTLLKNMSITYAVVDEKTEEEELRTIMTAFEEEFQKGNAAALLIRKNAFSAEEVKQYKNKYVMSREEILNIITNYSEEDFIISTTGKASRELYEIREQREKEHGLDFLTVGSMGHASSIALGLAMHLPEQRFWCIDGDGAVLMHMGAMALIGAEKPDNLIHIVINNSSHETVGGMPTAADEICLTKVAESCGYAFTASTENIEELESILAFVKKKRQLSFIEVKASISSRADLGRPKTKAIENKKLFMKKIMEKQEGLK